jgi:hypothetical protein
VFAAFLGVNPIRTSLEPTGVLHILPATNVDNLTGTQFFPHLISAPFHHGLIIVFTAAAAMSLLAAIASLVRGGRTTTGQAPAIQVRLAGVKQRSSVDIRR